MNVWADYLGIISLKCVENERLGRLSGNNQPKVC